MPIPCGELLTAAQGNQFTDLDVRDVSRGCPMAHARGVADGWGDRLDRCHIL